MEENEEGERFEEEGPATGRWKTPARALTAVWKTAYGASTPRPMSMRLRRGQKPRGVALKLVFKYFFYRLRHCNAN